MASTVTQMPPVSDRGWTYLGINILFLVLVNLAVAARLYSRRINRARPGWDDCFILAALVVYYGQFSFNVWVIFEGGLGHQRDEVPANATENMLLQLTISQFIYAVQFVLIRFSICALLMRIFPQRWLRHCMYGCIAITICWALFVIISALTICTPISYNWDLSVPGGHCNNTIKLNTYIVNSAWTIVYDVFILCIPQIPIWRLQMPTAAKAGVSFILALGVFDIIISIVRITAVVRVNFEDVTFADYSAQIWTVVEVSVAIIVACLPLCRWLIDRMLPRSLLSSSQGSGGSSNQRSKPLQPPSAMHNSWRPGKASTDLYHNLYEEDDTLELTAHGLSHYTPMDKSNEFVASGAVDDLESARMGNVSAATSGPRSSHEPVKGISVERDTMIMYSH